MIMEVFLRLMMKGTLENLITKFDKVQGFIKTSKDDVDLSRYFPNICQ